MSEDRGHKTALEVALAAFEEMRAEREQARAAAQGDLFGTEIAAAHGAAPGTAVGPRRPGRPVGARNRRTDHLVQFYIDRHYSGRDPLDMALSVATLPILQPGVLEALAERLYCSRHDAAKFWLGAQSAVLPYTHQRQASLEVRPAGAPGSGEPIPWEDNDVLDLATEGTAE